MANFLTYYKKYNPNLYSLMVSLLLALWYNGISGMLNYYWPVRGPHISFVFLLLPIILFLSDDGQLNELYAPPGIQYPIINQGSNVSDVSAIMAAATPNLSSDQINRAVQAGRINGTIQTARTNGAIQTARTNGATQAAIRRERFRI